MLLTAVLALALAVPPAPPGRVADYAGLLAPAAAARIDARLAEHERRTGSQMVVAIFRSLEGEDLEDYSIRLAQQWRIGRKGLDDGVILLIFVDDRRVRLEVGYGLEPVLPDAEAGRIIREAIAPAFRQERYAEGIEAAVAAISTRLAAGAAPATPPPAPGAPRVPLGLLLLVGATIIVVLLVAVAGPAPRSRRRGYTAGRRGWYVPPAVGGGWGVGRLGRGGGFGRGGGGFGGGGFSGGGGSFGGGGASGRW